MQRTVGQVGVAHAWGSTVAERAAPLPCDELLPEARCRLNRGVSVHAPVPALYRWLCQLSVAPYSYDLIDNRGRRSPQELIPGADRLEPGQRFMSILRLSSFERDDHLTLATAERPSPTPSAPVSRASGSWRGFCSSRPAVISAPRPSVRRLRSGTW